MDGRPNMQPERPERVKSVFMCRIPLWEPTGKKSRCSGVRASIVAMKPSNSGGAKGCRKVDT